MSSDVRATRRALTTALTLATIAGVVAGGAYAFAASTPVAAAPAAGTPATATEVVPSDPVWTIDAGHRPTFSKVVFELNSVTVDTQVYAGVDNGTTTTWSSPCSQGAIAAGSATEICTFSPKPTVGAVTKLEVSAVG